jgi:predicted Zn finger-like uncharacterized protein
MLIVCPKCSISYEVKAEAIGNAGRSVRCAHCRNEWVATAPPIQAVSITGPAEAAIEPSTDGAVFDRSAPAAALADHQVEWEIPASEPGQPAPAAADKNVAEEEVGVLWDIPEAPSPPLAPDVHAVGAAPATARARSKTPAAGKTVRTRWGARDRIKLPLAPTLVAVQFAVIGAGLLWHNEIVRAMPQTVSFFRAIGLNPNTRGLIFSNVRTSTDSHDGVTAFIIEGAIVNITHSTLSVPRLRFALRNPAFVELFSWTAQPDKGALGPGEMMSFRSRVASPPPGGSDILVRFLSHLDLMDGAR